ncbi:MAG: hypothetical protein K6F00_09845 [Lachnospiraceae bacterium]|nr:hypothetical protein [Lachnospiraceae bacterium]
MIAASVVFFLLPDPYEGSYLSELGEKLELIKNTEGKRVITAGGSAVAFGINSGMLEAEFGADIKVPENPNRIKDYKVINFGLYGSLGTKLMLELSAPYLHRDDIVIIIPEQQEDALRGYFDGKYYWQALGKKGFSFLFSLETDERNEALNKLLPYIAEKFKAVVWDGKSSAKNNGIYIKDNFNKYGDMEAERNTNIMPGGYDSDTSIVFDEDILENDFFKYVVRFIKNGEKNGTKVYFRLSPINNSAVRADKEQIKSYETALLNKLGTHLLGGTSSSVMDKSYFYDSNYHLTNDGAAYYTYNLINDLKARHKDYSHTDFDGAYNSKEVSKDTVSYNGNEEGFIFEEYDNGIKLTGITEELRNSEEILIPEFINDKEVIYISDGIFSGCNNLKKIIITVSSPENLRVGRGLLDGCSADIFVPEGSLSSYKMNYFWSTYSSRIFVD